MNIQTGSSLMHAYGPYSIERRQMIGTQVLGALSLIVSASVPEKLQLDAGLIHAAKGVESHEE